LDGGVVHRWPGSEHAVRSSASKRDDTLRGFLEERRVGVDAADGEDAVDHARPV